MSVKGLLMSISDGNHQEAGLFFFKLPTNVPVKFACIARHYFAVGVDVHSSSSAWSGVVVKTEDVI